jgi:hypothetical protein
MSETCPGRSADGSGPARPAPEVAPLASHLLDGRNRSTRSRTPLGHPIDRHVAEPSRLEHPSKAGSSAPTDTTINIEEHVMT